MIILRRVLVTVTSAAKTAASMRRRVETFKILSFLLHSGV